MSEFDFNKLKNIEIPDKWVKGALDVPQKPPVVFVYVKKFLPIVACVMLVIVLSFFVLFALSNEEKLSSKNPVTQPQDSTIMATLTNTQSESKTEAAKKPTQENSEPKTESIVSNNPDVAPVVKPSTSLQKPTQKPSDPSDTNIPSDPQGKPGDGTTDNPEGPTVDIEPEVPEPDTPAIPGSSVVLKAEFDERFLKGSNNVYVSIEKLNNGDLEVEGDKWEEQSKYSVHIVSIENSKVMVTFYPTIAGAVKDSGDYICTFYNHKGEVVYISMEYIEL